MQIHHTDKEISNICLSASRTQQIQVLTLTPCNAIPDEDTKAQWEEVVKAAEDDLQSLVGKTFHSRGQIRMVPDILQSGEDFFFPVFTSEKEMGEYGGSFFTSPEAFLRCHNNGKSK